MVMVQQEQADLAFVQEFFKARQLAAIRIPETTTKTPDFEILRNTETVAFCEMKSPQDIFEERVRTKITQSPAGQLAGVIERGNISRQYRCLERAAKKAASQFDAANPKHSLPNLLMIVNHDTHSRKDDFREVLTGCFGGVRTGQALRDGIPQIDLYLWLDAGATGSIEGFDSIFRHENPLKETIRSLLRL
jgi:hypothetical protein